MAANLQDITEVVHGMKGQSLSNSNTSVLSGGSVETVTYKINSIIIANKNGTSDVDVSVFWSGAVTTAFIANTVTVPADSTLVLTTKDNPIYLSAFCNLNAYASTSGDADILISYERITSSTSTGGLM